MNGQSCESISEKDPRSRGRQGILRSVASAAPAGYCRAYGTRLVGQGNPTTGKHALIRKSSLFPVMIIQPFQEFYR